MQQPLASTTVDCNRADLGTTHLKIDVYPVGVAFWFGVITPLGGIAFPATLYEFLPYSEYEEAELIYQDGQFNTDEIAAWTTGYEIMAKFRGNAA